MGRLNNKSKNTVVSDRYQYILDNYKNCVVGLTLQELSDELQINKDTLKNYMFRHNLFKNNNTVFDALIIKLLNFGFKTPKIIYLLNTSRYTIDAVRKEYNERNQ